jgi:hypothetical protein
MRFKIDWQKMLSGVFPFAAFTNRSKNMFNLLDLQQNGKCNGDYLVDSHKAAECRCIFQLGIGSPGRPSLDHH